MFQNVLLRVAGLVTCALFLVTVDVRVLAGDTPDSDAKRNGVKELMLERRAVLQEAVRAAEQAYRTGQTRLESVIELRRDLSHADLELTTTAQERIAIYKRFVGEIAALVKTTEAQYKAGQATQIDYLKSKAAHLQSKIDLARAELQAKDASRK
jgi:outer membrane protein TolC